jgi:hypothetical protein
VETKEMAEVVAPKLYVIPETNFKAMFPAPAVPSPIERVTAELWVRVPVYPVKSIERQTAGAAIVTLPEEAVATTSSAAVGTAASTQVVVLPQFPPPFAMVLVAIL